MKTRGLVTSWWNIMTSVLPSAKRRWFTLRINKTCICFLPSRVESHFVLITDCIKPNGVQTLFTCSGDKLVVKWLMNLRVPPSGAQSTAVIKQSLMSRTKAAAFSPSIVLLNSQPPWVCWLRVIVMSVRLSWQSPDTLENDWAICHSANVQWWLAGREEVLPIWNGAIVCSTITYHRRGKY